MKLIDVFLLKPQRPILITNSSFKPPKSKRAITGNTTGHSVDIFPQNEIVRGIPDTAEGVESLIQRVLDPPRIPIGEELSQDRFLTEKMKRRKGSGGRARIEPTVLICGHESRDSRCGVLGPILKAEFKKRLYAESSSLFHSSRSRKNLPLSLTSVALISHIGGHAFAGNVVIYFPPGFQSEKAKEVSPVAGKGIWYGRVEPQHVDGIVEETMKRGTIIQELLRGIHHPQGVEKPSETE